jgi:hypothetical protein
MDEAAPETPFAAYLYILALDPPDLAWEYLRRRTDYRQQWRDRSAGARFGLCFR